MSDDACFHLSQTFCGSLAPAAGFPRDFSATAQMPERSSKAEGRGFNRRTERQNTEPVKKCLCVSQVVQGVVAGEAILSVRSCVCLCYVCV